LTNYLRRKYLGVIRFSELPLPFDITNPPDVTTDSAVSRDFSLQNTQALQNLTYVTATSS